MGATSSKDSDLASRVVKTRVLRSENGDTRYEDDPLTIEEPLEIVVRSEAALVPMGVSFRTPGDDEALVLGMLFNEGVIQSRGDVLSLRVTRERDATVPATRLTATVAAHVVLDAERHRRAYPISAACGACGKSSLASLRIRRQAALPDAFGPRVGEETLCSLPERLLAGQSDFQRTGGLHAAARFNSAGELVGVAEDIGRHNAMDKLVGMALRGGLGSWDDQILLFSGRVGYDLMQKALSVGSPFVASIGAPSSFAVELASLFNVTLVGFLRGSRFNVYSAPQRIQFFK